MAVRFNVARVFPAPAGMNRPATIPSVRKIGVPRTRGDEPTAQVKEGEAEKCSPHPRG